MCGRFVASTSPDGLRRWFKTTNAVPNFAPSYDVAPTNSIPVVRFNPKTGERSLDLLHGV
jgi:putative SOS response-associated peptidase YedK